MPHRFDSSGDAIERLEGKERRTLVPRKEIVSRLDLAKRDLVVDLGAGTGYFTFQMAMKARAVLALDIDSKMLQVLCERIRSRKVRNVIPIRAEITSIPLPEESMDHVFAAFVYHEVNSTKRLLGQARKVLKPEGILTIVDFQKRETPIGPPVSERRKPAEVIRQASSGFKLESRSESDVYYQLRFSRL